MHVFGFVVAELGGGEDDAGVEEAGEAVGEGDGMPPDRDIL